uniref:Zgc:158640 n=1 Tax=Echeneis naucrates TaxID=173247 RepID=A0A665T564_ECHNA
MADSSLGSSGVKVVVASSGDENHPPENILDGNTKTFWMSTGMFPQEFIIRFAELTKISAVTVDTYNGRITIGFNNLNVYIFIEFEHREGRLQSNVISLNGSSATHLRFIITAGYDHFVSVHKVNVKY